MVKLVDDILNAVRNASDFAIEFAVKSAAMYGVLNAETIDDETKNMAYGFTLCLLILSFCFVSYVFISKAKATILFLYVYM